jgi:heptosyltransferase I
MQLALRASAAAVLVPARIKLGFDRAAPANAVAVHECAYRTAVPEHVLDSLFGFAESSVCTSARCGGTSLACGRPGLRLSRDSDGTPPALVISPCSSHALRNWSIERYAAAAIMPSRVTACRSCCAAAAVRSNTNTPRASNARCGTPCRNLVGQDTLVQVPGDACASHVLLSPDSGPAHMADDGRHAVIGLYAATNPQRSGPYYSRPWCVDRYGAAALEISRQAASALPWTEKIEKPGVMDLIEVADVTARLDAAAGCGRAAHADTPALVGLSRRLTPDRHCAIMRVRSSPDEAHP